MTEVGSITFNSNPHSTRSRNWPQPKTKYELEEEQCDSCRNRENCGNYNEYDFVEEDINDWLKNLRFDTTIPKTKKRSRKSSLRLTEGGHPMFNQLLVEISKLHASKNSDYAGSDPLSNFKQCERFGIPDYLGVLVRISDKYSRICSIMKKGAQEVKDESIEDTLKDLSVYSLLAIILLREAKQGGSQIKTEESR